MRGKKAFINSVACLIEELVAIVSAFIIPKLILTAYGSKYNGLITSITQFLSCAVLLRAGIGGATRAALYKPLAKKDYDEISAIIRATGNFMKKVGIILGIFIIVFSMIYPFFVSNDFDWFFSFSLFLIIGISTFAESFFGITYMNVLHADQKIWISSFLKSICYILNIIISVVLIKLNFGIHFVKLGSSIIYVAYPIIMQAYVIKKYRVNKTIKPNNIAIAQRWDAFWHQIATFVMANTDVIVLTIFTNVLEVSVYSIYNLVINGLKRFIVTFSNSLEGTFGNMIAKKENDNLNKNFKLIETMIYCISTIAYSCAIILILPFVKIYTFGVTDVNYLRPSFAYVLLIAQFFSCIRIPYQIIVQAAGHYKQTKTGAIIEPIINILISIIFVIKFGIIGVAIGTLVATIFRTVQYSTYISKNIIKRKMVVTFRRLSISTLEFILVIIISNILNINFALNYFGWIINSIIIFAIALTIVFSVEFLLNKESLLETIIKMKKIFNRKVNRNENN